MFEYMSGHDKILVTGPQRAGTRICAKMIAHDLPGHIYVDEVGIYTDSVYRAAIMLKDHERCVIHCPALSYIAHKLCDCVVMVWRDVGEIEASMKRIGWDESWGWLERLHYGEYEGCSLPEAKYGYWQDSQRTLVKFPYDVEYNSLSGHRLWIPASERAGFHWTQTEI